jgi:hypothetical protein
MKAGDHIEVLKQYLPDGWSLVSINGEAGLIPQTYYTVSGASNTMRNGIVLQFLRITSIRQKSQCLSRIRLITRGYRFGH